MKNNVIDTHQMNVYQFACLSDFLCTIIDSTA